MKFERLVWFQVHYPHPMFWWAFRLVCRRPLANVTRRNRILSPSTSLYLSLSPAPIHITGMNDRMNQIRYIWQRAGKAEEIEIANQIYDGLNPRPFKHFSTLSLVHKCPSLFPVQSTKTTWLNTYPVQRETRNFKRYLSSFEKET